MSTTGIGRASAILASGTIVSRLLGFVRAFLLAGVIGATGTIADAYNQAVYVPSSIYALIGGGLLSAILVPQIVRASGAADGGIAYVNRIVTIAIVAFAVLTTGVTLAAPWFMGLFISKPELLAAAVPLAYWSLPQIFFLGMYAVLGEVLNARRRFGAYTWAPVVNNIVAIATLGAFVLLFGTIGSQHTDPLGPSMSAVLAGGATLGLATQALVLALVWRSAGLRFRPDFRWRGVGLRATGQAAGWTFAMIALTQIAGLIEVRVAGGASGANHAAVAAMSYAWLIFMLPHSIVTVSLMTVFYPRMSEHAAAGETEELRRDLGQTLRVVLLVLVLADIALLAAALPFAAVFSRGDVTVAHAIAAVLVAYLLGLIPFTALFVLQRGFYALADTRTPFRFTLVQLAIVVPGTLLCLLLPAQWTAAGIALVVSVGTMVQVAVAGVLLRRRIGVFVDAGLRRAIGRFAAAALPALAAGLGLLAALGGFTAGWPVSSTLGGLVATALVAVASAAVYVAILAALRAPELGVAARLVTARLHR